MYNAQHQQDNHFKQRFIHVYKKFQAIIILLSSLSPYIHSPLDLCNGMMKTKGMPAPKNQKVHQHPISILLLLSISLQFAWLTLFIQC